MHVCKFRVGFMLVPCEFRVCVLSAGAEIMWIFHVGIYDGELRFDFEFMTWDGRAEAPTLARPTL